MGGGERKSFKDVKELQAAQALVGLKPLWRCGAFPSGDAPSGRQSQFPLGALAFGSAGDQGRNPLFGP